MNRAYVKTPDGKLHRVKNLGWVLRNWQGIVRLEWSSLNDAARELLGVHSITDGVFKVYMRDGREYATPYASFEVWKRWIDRPVLRRLPVEVNGIVGKV